MTAEQITVTLHCKACAHDRPLEATRHFIAWLFRVDEITKATTPTADFDEWECPFCYAQDVLSN